VNDATGLVALQLAVGVMVSGAFGWWEISGSFLWAVLGGLTIGLLAGKAAHEANRRIRDTTILFTISLVAPYVAFASAHALHASGVLAVVTAGFFVSWRIHAVAADTRYDLYAVWRLMAYVVDALAFLLLGIEIPRLVRAASPEGLPQLLVAGVLITLTVIVVRILWTYPAAYLPLLLFPRLRRREAEQRGAVFLTAWCGVRGAVSLAAALAVPLTLHGQPFPGRDAVVFCTFCVILGTLVIQGLTLQPLIRRLGLQHDINDGEEEQLARVSMIGAALSRLQYLQAKPDVDPAALEHVQAIYLERLRMLDDAPEPGARLGPAGSSSGLFAIELEALRAERQRLLNLRDTSNINDLTHDRLQEELDVAEMRARTHGRLSSSK
jgi:CPA1 family monovalent cation:H+ antiporter